MNPANRKILRNTFLLYGRLILLTFVNLFAVRVTLDALGEIDYGVYSVIASVVASLSILTGAMTSATQRFLSFHLGKQDYEAYSSTFTMLLMGFIAMAAILLTIGEVAGYFFLEDLLNIPPDRMDAAWWVFQTALVSFAFGLATIPYTSSIVANERMDAFAVFSIVEGVLKLAIAYLLIIYAGDRLILYGILTAAVSIVIFLMSLRYCHSKFRYCRYVWKWDKGVFIQLTGYTGWNLFGSVSGILATQGQNILLNIFFGPVINTAKAIADRIQNVVNGFSINLYMAASPQIIKSYAAEDYTRALDLVMKTSKMSFMLIFVIAFPLICNMDALLHLWLAEASQTPDMVVFSRLILLYCLILSLEPPISRIIQATGHIRNYQLAAGAVTLSFIPIATVALYMGAAPASTLVILICVMSVAQVVRVIIARRQVRLSGPAYFRTVLLPILKVMVIAVPVYLTIKGWHTGDSLPYVLLDVAVSGVFGLFIAAFLGLDRTERDRIMRMIISKIKKSK